MKKPTPTIEALRRLEALMKERSGRLLESALQRSRIQDYAYAAANQNIAVGLQIGMGIVSEEIELLTTKTRRKK